MLYNKNRAGNKKKGETEMLNSIITYLKARFSKRDGQGMVEYGLIIAVIAVVVLFALTPVGTAVSGVFNSIVGSINGVMNPPAGG